ncbi:receptor-type tyrosine-protein phosphatase F-like [Rhipicephalus sanguineus]|uniref:receptor-type tyrosine-protein phosphatase F-like n=1 Tax=Rhipicephalus sanguineus TaxID=34632 RepID=UPI001893AD0C|nr:receptor-type tyrosine-protein phosphatase F-like [Rhipicephalus sanguineus]
MEPQRALVLWTLPDRGEDEPRHYEVTWCCWVGGLSACQNKSSGTDGVVITHLGAWLIYDVAVGTRSALLFKARFRTRPDTPSEPMLLHVDRVGGGKALLSWTAPKAPRGPLQAYDVSWCTTSSCEALETPGKTRHVLLHDVQPSTNYTFRVRAKNVLEDTPLEGPHAEATVFTPPKGLIFQLVVSMWTAVSLSWTSVEQGGIVMGVFTVKHCLAEGVQAGSCEKFFVHDSRKVIANGQPWTMASVEVTDPSDALLFYTVYRSPPGRPSAPLEVQVSPLNSSALELRWSPPELGRGPVDGYLVKWHTFYGDGESLRLGSRDLRSLVIADVEELNTYTVQVAAYNLWSGSFLAGEEAVTYGISYSSGMNVNVSSGLTWAVLTWTLRHEVIEEVLLTCCEPEQPDACPHEVLLNSSARRHRLQGLEPWRAYDLRFFRYEGMALVLRKRFRTGKPVEAVPSLSPPDVAYTFLDDGSVLVSWIPSPGCAPAAAPTSNVSSGSDNGEGFLVSWAPVLQQDSSGANSVREEITADTHLTLRRLTPSTTYVVEVHALTACGTDDAPRVWALRIDTPPAAFPTAVPANATQ